MREFSPRSPPPLAGQRALNLAQHAMDVSERLMVPDLQNAVAAGFDLLEIVCMLASICGPPPPTPPRKGEGSALPSRQRCHQSKWIRLYAPPPISRRAVRIWPAL